MFRKRRFLMIANSVFHTLRYDNLTLAVKKILRGYQREETERVIAFRSHWATAVSTAIQRVATKRAAWRMRWAGIAATFWCRCRKREIWNG